MDFEARKLTALKGLASAEPDKSRKGGVDEPIIPLIERINAHPSFFTTSSCSGRISISNSPHHHISQEGTITPDEIPSKDNLQKNKQEEHSPNLLETTHIEEEEEEEEGSNTTRVPKKKKKKGGDWSYVSHSHADAAEIFHTVLQTCACAKEEQELSHSLMVFRFEPFILAVECVDLDAAQALVSCAISSGFRESGITSVRKRIIAAVRCSIRIEAPIAEGGQLLVTEEYIKFLVRIANEKMLNNRERTDKFFAAFIDQVESRLHERDSLPTSQANSMQMTTSVGHHHSHESESKPKGCDINRRKFLELEKRQVGILSRLDEVESRLCDLVPECTRVYGNLICGAKGVSSRRPQEDDLESQDMRIASSMPQLTQLRVPIEDNPAGLKKESVLSRVQKRGAAQSLHSLCEKGRSRCMLLSSLNVMSDKLYRWGHSTCLVPYNFSMPFPSLLIFGGYGGSIRQCRQNDLVLLTLDDGKVQSICATNPPAARMGHTASLVGQTMVVIGGREDPSKPLGDVCIFIFDKGQWVYPKVGGECFPPRHRHGSVVFEENIYVFGGLNNDNVLGDLFVLDISIMQWNRIECAANGPSPRYSHSMSVIDQKIFLFGGFDGRTVFGDLWVFNVINLSWSMVELNSISRFSHSMTFSSGFLVIIGGCPVTKHTNAVSLLHVDKMEWVHGKIDLPSEFLFVRHTATCIKDRIAIIGGGLSCYAFGIKFSPPFLMDMPLSPLLADNYDDTVSGILDKGHSEEEARSTSGVYGLMIDKVHAKTCKDNLKRLGWLDSKRRVRASEDGSHIIFPISAKAVCDLEASDIIHVLELSKLPCSACAFDCQIDLKIVELKPDAQLKSTIGPHQMLHMAFSSLLEKHEMPFAMLSELPKRWERLDDMAVLPADSFTSEHWSSLGKVLWETLAKCLNVRRLARQARVKPNGTRDSSLVLMYGEDGWVRHCENGILYCFDATKCIFSSGNVSEKLRMAKMDCAGETVVDLFAGIGYFVLPFLLKAKAEKVYACEWNPPALDALQYNLHANAVAQRCTVLEGDNHITAPKGIADRVCLGLLPTSEHCWKVAVKALRPAGGTLHIHGNVKDTDEQQWVEHVCESIKNLSLNEGHRWSVRAAHVERVKWYAPHIRHVVVDVKCAAK